MRGGRPGGGMGGPGGRPGGMGGIRGPGGRRPMFGGMWMRPLMGWFPGMWHRRGCGCLAPVMMLGLVAVIGLPFIF